MADKKLNNKQQQFLVALTTSETVDEACETVGIGRSTAYRYMRDETFKAEQRKMTRETMRTVRGRLQYEALHAINVLAEVMHDKEAPTYSRVDASKTILDMAFKGHEIDDILERIEELENKSEVEEWKKI